MKTKWIVMLGGILVMGWVFFFQAAQTASSSPLMRITFTPSPTNTVPVTATQPIATLPPPPVLTNPPLIPVTGSEASLPMDWLIMGGMLLLVLGVVGAAWPERRRYRRR